MVLIEEEQDKKPSSPNNDDANKEANKNSQYECNICLDTARDAVISMCGHLFCWPCLHKWLETRPNNQTCPVCKSAISKDKVIPLYGRNSTDKTDPREKVPPRPQGQRTESQRQPNAGFPGFGFDGFQVSFGIGAFPFSFLATTFNFGGGVNPATGSSASDRIPSPAPGTAQYAEEQFLSRVFLIVAIIFIIWILLA